MIDRIERDRWMSTLKLALIYFLSIGLTILASQIPFYQHLIVAPLDNQELAIRRYLQASTLFLEHPNLTYGMIYFLKNSVLNSLIFPMQVLIWGLIRLGWSELSFSLMDLAVGEFALSYILFFNVWIWSQFL